MKEERLSGEWWLPGAPKRKVAGTLAYESKGHPTLDLMGTLSDDSDSIRGATVLGVAGNAEPITAEIDFETGRSVAFSEYSAARQSVAVKRAIVGAHLAEVAERTFLRMSVSFTDLLPWTGWHGPQVDYATGSVNIRYTAPEELSTDVPWGRLAVGSSWRTEGDGVKSRSIAIGAAFLCERPDAADATTWLSEVVRPLRDFMTIATDRANQVESIEFESAPGRPFSRFIYAPTMVELPPAAAYSLDFPTTATALAGAFASILDRWFHLHHELGAALDLFLSTLYRPSADLENRFLNMAAAAEAYHRRRAPTPPDALAKHTARLARMTRSLASAKDRHWLEWRLRYAYEPTFEERLAELGHRSEAIVGQWLPEPAAFGRQVSSARNSLVHRDPGASVPPPDGRTLLDYMEDVGIVLLVCIYQDLGFADAEIAESLARTDRWRFLLFRKHGWRD